MVTNGHIKERGTMERAFNVIVDTREKQPWDLVGGKVLGAIHKKLDTGDYSIEGLEDKIAIDRKASVNELAGNINQKRFKDELMRIKEFPHAFIILEASASDVYGYPDSADLPPHVRKKIRMNGNFLMKCLSRMSIAYGFNLIFAGTRSNAQRMAVQLMEEVANLYQHESSTEVT